MSNYTVSVNLEAKDTLSPALQTANQEMGNLKDGAEETGGGLNVLEQGAQVVAVAFAAWKLADQVIQLNNLGDAANDTETTFTQLAGGVKQADDMMAILRQSSGGIIDDMTLQAQASSALSQNLVTSAAQMGELVNIGEKLGTSMGKTATEGVDAFMSALASGRPAQLREIGIDAQAVQERMDELKKSGVSAMDAFRQAAFEQGAQSLERLGAAALVGEDGLTKLQTRLENLKQNIGQTVNNTVDAAATTLDQLVQIIEIRSGSSPAQQAAANAASDLAKSFTDEYTVAISEYMGQTEFDSGEAAQKWAESISNAFTLVVNNPQLLKDKDALMAALTDVPDDMKSGMADALIMSVDDSRYQKAADMINQKRQDDQRAAGEAAAKKYINAFADQWRTGAAQIYGTLHDVAVGLDDTASIEAWKAKQQAIADATTEVSNFANAYSGIDAVNFDVTNVTDTGTVSMMLDDAKTKFAELQGMAKDGLISETDLTNSQGMVDNLQTMKDKIDGIQKMTLDGLLGKSNGGVEGELSTQLLDNAKTSGGMTDAQLADLQKTLDLATGKETASSTTLETDVMPIITDIAKQLGPQAAAAALKNVSEYLKEGQYLNLSDADLAAGLQGATGFQYDPRARDAAKGTMGQYSQVQGFDASQYAMGNITPEITESMQSMSENTQAMADSATIVNTQMSEVNSTAKILETTMSRITQSTYTVKVNLDITGLDKLAGITGMSGGNGNGTSTSASNPRNNGGRVPGQDSRTSD